MKRTNARRATGIAALALTVPFGLAACGSDDSGTAASDKPMSSSSMSVKIGSAAVGSIHRPCALA